MQLDDSDYAAAQATFSSAVRDQPQRWEGLYGLGVASYYLGDLAVARLAVDAAQKLQGVDGAGAVSIQRLQLMVSAAGADPASNELAADYARVNPGDRLVLRRVSELSRDANASQLDADPAAGGAGAAGEAPPNNQVLVDVTLILSSMLDTYNRGVNLFDGLSVQYGYGNNFSASRAAGAEWNSNRSITHGISVPQLNYSLNLFNNAGQFYQVLARPSLTAYLGRESEFFAGRTINVRVSGVNLGTLQPIDVGVGLKVTPEALNAKKVTFRVSASRSFLSREQIGTFQESLTTFKQLVSATAEVEFGQTLVLSALSESVQDSTVSKTPGLSQIPGLSTFFKKSTTANRQESLLILITPVLPTAVRVRENLRPATVDKLISMWNNLIDPRSSVDAILDRFGRSPFFRGAQSGDLRWRQVITPQLGEEALRENAQLAGLID
jgi:Flp pilus assembly secretin CpaC